MKKQITKLLASVLALTMVVTAIPVNFMTVHAKETENMEAQTVSDGEAQREEVVLPVYQTTSGTFGYNDGFSWSYDESTKTLTVTGEDSGLTRLDSEAPTYNVENIVFKDCVVSGSLGYLLSEFYGLKHVEFQNFDTSNVTGMNGMFAGCNSLVSLDLSGLDTSNVTSMQYMFQDCSSLVSLDLSGFDTSKVTDMQGMFADCSSLASVDLSSFDTSKVTDMGYMFEDCESLVSLELSSFDISNVTDDISFMIFNCSSLESIRTPKTMAGEQNIYLPYVFCDAEGKPTKRLDSDYCNNTLTKAEDISHFFGNNYAFSWSYDESTATLTVTGKDSGLNNMRSSVPVVSEAKNIVFKDCVVSGSLSSLLYGLENLESVEFQNFDTSKVTDMRSMFYKCSKVSSLDVSGFDTSNVTDMSFMFYECNKVSSLEVSGFDTSNVTNMSCMFYLCGSLSSLDVSGFDTSKVTDMSSMFVGCGSLPQLDVSGFDTSKVTNMSQMFGFCGSLTSLDVSGFDTSNVTDMGIMFSNCAFSTLDVSGFNTSKVTDMGNMFFDCSNLKSIDLSGFDTSNVTNMSAMFTWCESLENVNLSGFDTSNVTDISAMFMGCTGLNAADLNSFELSSVVDTDRMFEGCTGLTSIKTPKSMAEEISINLPASFYNSKKKSISEITTAYCSQILTRPETEYTITYYLDGGKNHTGNPATYTKKTATITLKAPTQKGYTFNGWYSDDSYKTKVTKIEKGNSGEVELYAKWTPNKYTVKFVGNGATGGKMSSLINRKYGNLFKLTANAYKRKGYTFSGWNTKANGSGKNYANKASVKNLTSTNGGIVTLYAQWKNDTYNVTYKLNGGKNHKSNPSSYTVTNAITLKKPTRTGYTFNGWYSDSKYKKKVTKIAKGSTGNKTLYAKWTPIKYTIKFNGNGATSGKMKNLTNRKYGTAYKLTANSFKKKGYKFMGWNTKKNGKGKTYKNKASVKNLISANGKTVTLYAQWKKK